MISYIKVKTITGCILSIGILTIHFLIPGALSLKEKRGRLKPVIARLRKQFNLSVAEMDRQDVWNEAVIACAVISTDAVQCQRVLQQAVRDFEDQWPDLTLLDDHLELM